MYIVGAKPGFTDLDQQAQRHLLHQTVERAH